MTDDAYRTKADFFKALAHPARIEILHALRHGEVGVSDLQHQLGLEQSHLSQQLGVLRRAGVVTARREGNSVRYSVRDPRLFHLLHNAREIVATSLSEADEVVAALRRLEFDPAPPGSG